MVLNKTWEGADLSTVSNNGVGYLYTLLCDYERYVRDFGFIDVEEFLQKWTCIPYNAFVNLAPGDTVYAFHGQKYIVVDEPWEADNESYMYIAITKLNDDGTFDDTGKYNEILNNGDLYAYDKIHMDYYHKKKKKESEEPICPILITKTNQPQS